MDVLRYLRLEEVNQRFGHPLGIVLHRDVVGRLDTNEPRFRDLPRVAFGIVDRLEWVIFT
jgi:hypothetical protein